MSSPPTLLLHGPPQEPGHGSLSGYCQKLETFLRHTKVAYTRSPANFRDSPSGKVPFVTLTSSSSSSSSSSKPEILTDSHFIANSLVARGIAPDPDAGLTPVQRADARALAVWTQELAYPAVVHTRWARDHNYAVIYLQLPAAGFLRPLFGWYIRRHVVNLLWAAGVGRYSTEQIDELIQEWVDSLDARLEAGSGKWIMGGEEPTSADISVWSFLMNILEGGQGNSEAWKMVTEKKNLRAYARRGGDRWYPEWEGEWVRLLGEENA